MHLFPLTHPQKRIWYSGKIYPGSSIYNISGIVIIHGCINPAILSTAINQFIKANDGIRIRLIQDNNEPKQYIEEYKEEKIDFLDFSLYPEPEEQYYKWSLSKLKEPFRLLDNSLYYFAVFKISDIKYGYFMKLHHIIADGWSAVLSDTQIKNNYEQLKTQTTPLLQAEPSYLLFTDEEKTYLASPRFIKNKIYWNRKFQTLPCKWKTINSPDISGKRIEYKLDEKQAGELKDFAGKHKYTLNSVFLSSFLLWIHKYYRIDDITIGIPVLNRIGAINKKILGMFTSTVPFRLAINTLDTSENLFTAVNRELGECYINQRYPYDLLAEDLELRKKGYDGLFDFSFNYYNSTPAGSLDGYRIENIEYYSGQQYYSLQTVVKEWGNNLTVYFDYKTADFTETEMNNIPGYFFTILKQITGNDSIRIDSINLLAAEEKEKILVDFNDTCSNFTLHKTFVDLFQETAGIFRDSIALEFKEKKITYRELEQRSTSLAKNLVEKGVISGEVIAIHAAHSPELIMAIIAILKCGAVYLPLAPGTPVERLKFILADAAVRFVMTDLAEDLLLPSGVGAINILQCHEPGSAVVLNHRPSPGDTAYIIYTSGTTGLPKGVEISHKNLTNYICWSDNVYCHKTPQVFAFFSSIAFDLTITSVFTPLINGSKIKIFRPDPNQFVLYDVIKDKEISVLKMTPSHLSLLQDSDFTGSQLHTLIIGGEELKTSLAEKIWEKTGKKINIYNEYGPTEATVGCMLHKYDPCDPPAASVPIGKPAANSRIYILDNNLNPLPSGVTGEIYIGGSGVAKGYLNNAELTQARFVKDIFTPGGYLYRSGDLGLMNSGYIMEYKGRIDKQIKIGGQRIEIGEIEHNILAYPGITAAVVLLHTGRPDSVVAFYSASEPVDERLLHTYLSERLPSYMLPAYYCRIDQFPLTANGKIDETQLPFPAHEKEFSCTPLCSSTGELFLNGLKEILAVKELELDNNFFALGGDSIKAIQFSTWLNRQGFILKVPDILANPVFSNMLQYLSENTNARINESPVSGKIMPTPIIQWFCDLELKNPHYYNQSVLLELKFIPDWAMLNRLLIQIINHHDIFQTNFDMKSRALFYNKERQFPANLPEMYDLGKNDETDAISELYRITYDIQTGFNLENGLLFKAALFQFPGGINYLLLCAHHLIIDAFSWRIFLEDLKLLLKQELQNTEFKLPDKTASYQQWAEYINRDLNTKELKSNLNFWRNYLADNELSNSYLPVIREKMETSGKYFQFGPELTKIILTSANISFNTKPYELRLSRNLK